MNHESWLVEVPGSDKKLVYPRHLPRHILMMKGLKGCETSPITKTHRSFGCHELPFSVSLRLLKTKKTWVVGFSSLIEGQLVRWSGVVLHVFSPEKVTKMTYGSKRGHDFKNLENTPTKITPKSFELYLIN